MKKRTISALLILFVMLFIFAPVRAEIPHPDPNSGNPLDYEGKWIIDGMTEDSTTWTLELNAEDGSYKLYNEIGWDDPLPSSDSSKGAFFFDLIGQERGNNMQRETPEVKDLFTIAEIDAFFGLKVKKLFWSPTWRCTPEIILVSCTKLLK